MKDGEKYIFWEGCLLNNLKSRKITVSHSFFHSLISYNVWEAAINKCKQIKKRYSFHLFVCEVQVKIKGEYFSFRLSPIHASFSNWTASSEFGTYRLCEQRRFRRACASAQSRQNLRCSLIQALNQEEPSDRKPDPWPLWMAGHAQLKFVMTECSKTQIRLTRLNWFLPLIFQHIIFDASYINFGVKLFRSKFFICHWTSCSNIFQNISGCYSNSEGEK